MLLVLDHCSSPYGKADILDESDLMHGSFMDVDVLHASKCPLNEGGRHMHFTDMPRVRPTLDTSPSSGLCILLQCYTATAGKRGGVA